MVDKKDCLFCKIVKGDVSSLKVYEDDKITAFLDIAQINAGHTLVILKEHSDSFSELSDEAAAELMTSVKNLAPKIAKAVGATGFNIGINNGRVAGQIIPHTHVHVIPRFDKDGLKHWAGKKYEDKVMNALAEKIKKAL